MANQLTSSGLTVGSGTITNFIPAFGSNVISNGLWGGVHRTEPLSSLKEVA